MNIIFTLIKATGSKIYRVPMVHEVGRGWQLFLFWFALEDQSRGSKDNKENNEGDEEEEKWNLE